MNPLTLEWAQKAENDLLTAQREYRVRSNPNYDAVCFHAQQAAEKYLKAALQESGIPIPRVHSLAELLALLSRFDPDYLGLRLDSNVMEGYATQFRYPGLSASLEEAREALSAAKRVCGFVKSKIEPLSDL
jgi:HEPN domain-containing protein